MIITATKLRQNLYRILDEILDSGIPVKINRKGEILKIMPEKKKSKLERLTEHSTIIGDPESIISINFDNEWKEKENL
ncbi:MAG: type II toxin-antitoxin system Phd/YefM family antitoxin [Actinobacteria bacterium]|nr:type II toxin-antitoxin system Phd/YefM family antitoxin [Actinomycetota bacterium]